MKKLTKSLAAGIGTLLLALLLCVPAFAEAQLGYVTDAAGLLTEGECATLEQQAKTISEQYECGVYIITLEDFSYYVNTDDVDEAAKSLYSEYGLGYGADKSGILLMQSTAARDYALVAYGYGNTAFTDYGKEQLADAFTDNFGNEDYVGGYTDYLAKCASMLESARDGHPLDVKSNPLVFLVGILITLGLGCGLAGVICFFLRQTMNSVAKGVEADAYIPAESVAITGRNDVFTHTTEVRTKIEKKSGGGGLGGTTIDSAGFSSKSGKY